MSSVWTIRRSAQDHKVSGLAAGIGQHWNVDPVLVRVGFVVLAFTGGIGLVLYGAGWLMVPIDGRDRSQLDELWPQTRRWSKEWRVAIVAAACLLCLGASSWVVPVGLVAAAVLAAVWYFGYYKHRPSPPEPDDPADPDAAQTAAEEPAFFDYSGPSTPFTTAARAWQDRILAERRARAATDPSVTESSGHGGGSTGANAPTSAPGPVAGTPTDDQPDPERVAYLATPDPVGLYTSPASAPQDEVDTPDRMRLERRRSARRLGLVTVICLGVTLSGLGVASGTGLTIPVSGYLSAVLLVLGLALLAGTRYGRPPGAAPAAVVVGMSLVASLVVAQPTVLGRHLGARSVSYDTAAALPHQDRVSLGRLRVDLSDLTLTGDHTYRARVDTGQLHVVVPKGTRTRVRARVGNGRLHTPGKTRSGSDLAIDTRVGASPHHRSHHGQELTVVLRVDRGALEVDT